MFVVISFLSRGHTPPPTLWLIMVIWMWTAVMMIPEKTKAIESKAERSMNWTID